MPFFLTAHEFYIKAPDLELVQKYLHQLIKVHKYQFFLVPVFLHTKHTLPLATFIVISSRPII